MFLLSFSKFLLHFLTQWSSLKTKQSKNLSLLVCQDQPYLIAFSLFLVCLGSSFVSGHIQIVSSLRQELSIFDPCSVLSVKVVQINSTNDVLLKYVIILYCGTQLIQLVSQEMQATLPVTVCCILMGVESMKFYSVVYKACSELKSLYYFLMYYGVCKLLHEMPRANDFLFRDVKFSKTASIFISI